LQQEKDELYGKLAEMKTTKDNIEELTQLLKREISDLRKELSKRPICLKQRP